eukprot:1143883-Pelagomonas_calceolata.AAC.7
MHVDCVKKKVTLSAGIMASTAAAEASREWDMSEEVQPCRIGSVGDTTDPEKKGGVCNAMAGACLADSTKKEQVFLV